MKKKLLTISLGLLLSGEASAMSLPLPDDIPEEVLRTEIIIDARSPLNNQPISASEYALLREELANSPYPPQLSPKLQQLIFLIQIRRMLKTFIPLV